MRRFTGVALLLLGSAAFVPAALLANTASARRNCNANCDHGSCNSSGSGCTCYCDTMGYPHCSCKT